MSGPARSQSLALRRLSFLSLFGSNLEHAGMRLRRSKMDATAASIDEPAITGVSVAGANGDVAIFIERSEQVPERLLKRGRRIVIEWGPEASSAMPCTAGSPPA